MKISHCEVALATEAISRANHIIKSHEIASSFAAANILAMI
jgi:hypothetical protein